VKGLRMKRMTTPGRPSPMSNWLWDRCEGFLAACWVIVEWAKHRNREK